MLIPLPLELWQVAPRIERKKVRSIDNLCCACPIDWPDRADEAEAQTKPSDGGATRALKRHWLAATDDGTLHLLRHDLLLLRTFKLALSGSGGGGASLASGGAGGSSTALVALDGGADDDAAAATRPKLTAVSLLPNAEKTLASAALCCGFDDGSLRRFHVLDLKLNESL